MNSRALVEADHTILSIYKKLCNLDRDLNQTAFILLLTPRFPLVGYLIKGQRNTFATLESSNVIFNCKTVSSPLYVLRTNTSNAYPSTIKIISKCRSSNMQNFFWSIKAPCKADSCDPQNRLKQINFTEQRLGIYSQRDWKNSIEKLKVNQ